MTADRLYPAEATLVYVRTALCERQADEDVVTSDLWRFLRHWPTDSSQRHCGVDIDRQRTRAAQTGTGATWFSGTNGASPDIAGHGLFPPDDGGAHRD